MKVIYLFSLLLVFCVSGYSVTLSQTHFKTKKIISGAEQPDEYLPYLKGKRVGILANQTTITDGGEHPVDFLLSKGINVDKVFGPEHARTKTQVPSATRMCVLSPAALPALSRS